MLLKSCPVCPAGSRHAASWFPRWHTDVRGRWRRSSTLEALRDAHIKEQTLQNFTTEPNVWYSAVKLRSFKTQWHLVNRLNTRMAAKQLLSDHSVRQCQAPFSLWFNFTCAAGGADRLGQPREEKEDFQHVRHKEDYSAVDEEAPQHLNASELLTSSEDKGGGEKWGRGNV